MLIRWVAKIIAAINSNSRSGEMAAGGAFGVMLALIPSGNLLWIVLFVLTIFIKLNLGLELVFLGLFRLFVPLFDGVLHHIGLTVLSLPVLEGAFTGLYNLPLLPFTRFNNTVVMGALVAGVALWLPLFILIRLLIGVYRKTLRDRIASSRLVKGIGKLPLISTLAKAVRRASGLAAA